MQKQHVEPRTESEETMAQRVGEVFLGAIDRVAEIYDLTSDKVIEMVYANNESLSYHLGQAAEEFEEFIVLYILKEAGLKPVEPSE